MHVLTKKEIGKQKNKLKAILYLFLNYAYIALNLFVCLFPSESHDIFFSLFIFTKALVADRLEQWFSALSVSKSLECLFKKYSLLGSTEFLMHYFWGMAQKFAFLNGFSGDADAAGVGTTLWEPLTRWECSHLWIRNTKIRIG